MNTLYHVGQADLQRILKIELPAIEKTRIFAVIARLNTLYMIARAGSGHIGSSFSSMDIFSWLYLNVLQDEDTFFSSKGHDAPGLYSVLIGLGKLDYENIHRLRRLNGLPGHPDVGSPCMVTNTGSLGMGISKAKGMARANRLDGKPGRFYVVTGDGELQEGQFWESLPGAVNGKFDEITVIVDHNKIQSDTWVKNVSDLGELQIKFKSYGWHVQRCDGHNLEELAAAINCAKGVRGIPQIIIADTIKGCGVSFMESINMSGGEEFYSFHSGAPSPKHYKQAVQELIEKANDLLFKAGIAPLELEGVEREEVLAPADNLQRLIPVYENALLEAGKRRDDLVVLDADLMIDCGLLSLRNVYPDRFIECGIAEQDMVSQAGAMALKGKVPIVHSFACFLATRANEQIFNNASERTKCIYVGSLAGILPAGPGHSHQMVRDISVLGSIPGLILLEPSCEAEVRMVLEYAVDSNPFSTYIRIVSIPYEVPFELPEKYKLEVGKGVAITEGEDAIIFAYGPVMLSEAYKVAKNIKQKKGVGIKVVNLPWLNNIDVNWLQSITREVKHIFTLDNHLLDGGQGERIGCVLAELGGACEVRFTRLGLNDIPMCGQNDEVLAYHGLDSVAIEKTILRKMDI